MQAAMAATPSSRPGGFPVTIEGRPSGAGLRHFRVLSSPSEEIGLTPRFLFRPSCLALALLVFGCSKSENPVGCRRPQAPFRLQLTAEDGPLPYDTHLVVRYLTKLDYEEDYDLLHPPSNNLDVCCRPGAAVDGKLPSVPCGGPNPLPDASVANDAASYLEAGSDASTAFSDAAPEGGDASRDVQSIPEGGTTTDSGGHPSHDAPEALLCELWTTGPAEIVVTGASYPRLDRVLSVELDECGTVTRDVRVIWARGDAGR